MDQPGSGERGARAGGVAARGGSGGPAALRHSVRGEGQHGRGRHADHRRLPGVRLHARTHRDRGAAPARCRRDPDRQDQPGSVRHRPGRNPFAVRRAALRVQSALRLRRVELRLRGRGRGRSGRLRARHRHRRLRTGTCGVQQSCRHQAQPRPDQHGRHRPRLSQPRLRQRAGRHGPGRPRRRRRRSGFGSARSVLARRSADGIAAFGIAGRRARRGGPSLRRRSRIRGAVRRGDRADARAGRRNPDL